MVDNARADAIRNWFGYGNWGAPYWFVGMEPGGRDVPENFASWDRLGRGELIDASAHERDWNANAPESKRTTFFQESPKPQRGTWQPLIHVLLGFLGSDEDPRLFQRDKWGSAGGKMALIELSAIAARNTSIPTTERLAYREKRVETLKARLREHKPTFALFYGTSYRLEYEKIAGGPFDSEGIHWAGPTLCVLTTHPARPTRSYQYWKELGARMQTIIETSGPVAR